MAPELSDVAPHVGAWIEILRAANALQQWLSHPTWVRGLKLLIYGTVVNIDRSHPTWVRGLKSPLRILIASLIRSHPTWVRGLKSLIGLQSLCHAVAPHVGAWIEILIVLTIC